MSSPPGPPPGPPIPEYSVEQPANISNDYNAMLDERKDKPDKIEQLLFEDIWNIAQTRGITWKKQEQEFKEEWEMQTEPRQDWSEWLKTKVQKLIQQYFTPSEMAVAFYKMREERGKEEAIDGRMFTSLWNIARWRQTDWTTVEKKLHEEFDLVYEADGTELDRVEWMKDRVPREEKIFKGLSEIARNKGNTNVYRELDVFRMEFEKQEEAGDWYNWLEKRIKKETDEQAQRKFQKDQEIFRAQDEKAEKEMQANKFAKGERELAAMRGKMVDAIVEKDDWADKEKLYLGPTRSQLGRAGKMLFFADKGFDSPKHFWPRIMPRKKEVTVGGKRTRTKRRGKSRTKRRRGRRRKSGRVRGKSRTARRRKSRRYRRKSRRRMR